MICANCHSNMNHIAPLFAHYDVNGSTQTTSPCRCRCPTNPMVAMTDYLPAGEGLAWRYGVPVADMTSLGHAMAADPAIADVRGRPRVELGDGQDRHRRRRLHGYRPRRSQTRSTAFIAGGYKMRDAIYRVFTSDDFVRF